MRLTGPAVPTYRVNVSSGICTTTARTKTFYVSPTINTARLSASTACGTVTITWTAVGDEFCEDYFSPLGLPIGQRYTRSGPAKGTIGARRFNGSGVFSWSWYLTGLP